jgi:hypothetical protein
MPASIPHFVSLEVRSIDAFGRLRFLAPLWHWALIAVIGMETIVDVAPEVVTTMKPRTNANENAIVKPLWTVVASGSTGIRSNVIVTIWTIRGYADFDADLSLCFGRGSREADYNDSR